MVAKIAEQKVTKAFPPFSVLKFLSFHFVSQQFLVLSSKRHFITSVAKSKGTSCREVED